MPPPDLNGHRFTEHPFQGDLWQCKCGAWQSASMPLPNKATCDCLMCKPCPVNHAALVTGEPPPARAQEQ